MLPVYDIVLFFNELELLELRCEELKGVVEKHIIIEATTTFQGKDKPLHYLENKERFSQYPIESVVIDLPHRGSPDQNQVWTNEHEARNIGFLEAIKDIDNDDIVLLSDADEIPRASKILQDLDDPRASIAIAMMDFHYYWLNFRYDQEIWAGTVRTPAWRVRDYGGEATFLQRKNYGNLYQIQNGGWHFSYQGGVERIQDKLRAFAHSEYSGPQYTDENHLKDVLRSGGDLFGRGKQFRRVDIGDDYPVYLRENKDKFSHMIS